MSAEKFTFTIERAPGLDLSKQCAMKFDKNQTIPQSNKTLRRGQSIEGYLLAMAREPIPAEIRHGASLTAELTVFDQFDEGRAAGPAKQNVFEICRLVRV